MADTTETTDGTAAKSAATARKKIAEATSSVETAMTDGIGEAKSRFNKAIEEAKAGAEALKDEALGRTTAYKEKVAGSASDWTEDAKVYAGQAKDKAADLANQGKSKASDALTGLGKTLADTSSTIDEKLGVQYGDYARSAARSIQEAAAKLESKDLNELGEEAKELVRKSPGVAIGIAAVAGFMLSRLFRGSSD
ncbi:hypothetical protein [Novosphingobium lentum]|uniref:hypothetical protein n=1 Tax=Novosphingobium lentum TaxID=145287 RepID=UPI000832C9B3|nr:hypothetical protein [Novosphingobium lentum]